MLCERKNGICFLKCPSTSVYLANCKEAQSFHLFAITTKLLAFKLFFSLKMHMTWNTGLTYNFRSFNEITFKRRMVLFYCPCVIFTQDQIIRRSFDFHLGMPLKRGKLKGFQTSLKYSHLFRADVISFSLFWRKQAYFTSIGICFCIMLPTYALFPWLLNAWILAFFFFKLLPIFISSTLSSS